MSAAKGRGQGGEKSLDELNRPLRSEILARDKLEQLGLTLADEHAGRFAEQWGGNVFRRFRENTFAIEHAYFEFAKAAKKNQPLAPGAEWLLDNYHVIEEHVRDIRTHLPRGYYKTLPKLIDGEYQGFPRVYHLAIEFISHTDAIVTRDALTAFAQSYQTKSTLRIGELWALPIMLRLALIENLRRLAHVSVVAKSEREEIDQFLDTIAVDPNQTASEAILRLAARFREKPVISMAAGVHALRRLRGLGSKGRLSLQWLEERLREQGMDPDEIVRTEHQFEAANQISIGNCVTSLKTVSSFNWRSWVEELSAIDKILRNDPARSYLSCNFATRDLYRHRIERYARRTKKSETEIARAAVTLAENGALTEGFRGDKDLRHRHVGYYLLAEGQNELEAAIGLSRSISVRAFRWLEAHAFPLYIGAITTLAGLFVVRLQTHLAAHQVDSTTLAVALFLFLVPALTLATDIIQWLITAYRRPTELPKLEFEHGIPESWRTIVTVHAIFHDVESITKAAELLEVRYLGNADPNLSFALLADLPNAPAESMPSDFALIEAAQKRLEELNREYSSHGQTKFFLLFRRRRWNASEGAFMGWERKRGKVDEFNRLLRGDDSTSFDVLVGSVSELRKNRFVLTLDGDSQLPRGAAEQLVGTLAHPLNRPVLDPESKKVVQGYAIIQPRIGVSLTSANVSPFSQAFSGFTGLDPYTHAVSDVYQDLFHEGTYVGKGIYDVDAFELALDRRVPENALLSHDLFESTFARTALATDIELIDDFPSRYNTHSRRQHRWIRGDWQLLPWLFPSVPDEDWKWYKNPISPLGRWKIFDNLRRSLVAPTLFLFAVFAWCALPGAAFTWTSLVFLILWFPVIPLVLTALSSPPSGISTSLYLQSLGRNALRILEQGFYTAAFLGYQAYLAVSAIVTTLFRVYFSRRNLLEWETAYYTERRAGTGLPAFLRELGPGALLGVFGAFFVFRTAPQNALGALPLLVLWISSPVLASLISQPRPSRLATLKPDDERYLRQIAWDTWRYFDDHLIEKYNYLIPDNLQVVPEPVVAERTSPTNIALSLLGIVSAYDLGFIPLTTVIERTENTFNTLRKMERFNGHFLNWYQIVTLEPLRPRYVSMVDSGNMAGHFVALRAALEELAIVPLLRAVHINHLAQRIRDFGATEAVQVAIASPLNRLEKIDPVSFTGFAEVMTAVAEIVGHLEKESPTTQDPHRVVKELRALLHSAELTNWVPLLQKVHGELGPSASTAELRSLRARADEFATSLSAQILSIQRCVSVLPSLLEFAESLRVAALAQQLEGLAATALELRCQVGCALERANSLQHTRTSLMSECTRYIEEMDFRFLFDSDKKLFVIGYNIDDARRDDSYYDLLASEARLGSFVAIAKEDVSQQHWFMLGRMLANSPGGRALLSWSATMFEYLMPLLVMKDFPGTLLSETYRAVVRTQQHYGRHRGVPWGISESGYSGVDFEKTYQYRAFGVPGLGLKRGLSEDLVVSPYSTFMALPIDLEGSLANVRALEEGGLRGEYGFYESIDYTPERLAADERGHVVRSFLGHHQGMTLVSINNVINHGIFQERFHSDPAIKATELLLQERFPDRIPAIVPHQAELSFIERQNETPTGRERKFTTPHTPLPEAHILSNSRYSVLIDNEGSGYSFAEGGIALTRWREDACSNNFGSYIFVRDLDSKKIWSTTYQPTLVEAERYEAIFNPDKVEFKRIDNGIALRTEISVSPEENVEIRRVTAHNVSGLDRHLELTSYSEVVVGSMRGDFAHPAFSKMFVQSEFLEDFDAVLFRRRPRSDHEKPLFMLHMLTMNVVWAKTQFETSRSAFLGRGRTIANPQAFDTVDPLPGTAGSVLDPIASLRARIELLRGESATASFITAFTTSREDALNLARKYREPALITRAFEMAWSQSNIEIRFEHFSLAQTYLFQELASAILFNRRDRRAEAQVIQGNRLTQSGLWRFGISGDIPIVLLRMSDSAQMPILRELVLAHDYLKARLFEFDLVILNEYPGGYLQKFQEEIESQVRIGQFGSLNEKQRGIFIRNLTQLSAEEINLVKAVARVIINADDGALGSQLAMTDGVAARPAAAKAASYRSTRREPKGRVQGDFYNGIGAFTDSGYHLSVTSEALPPAPWSNVVANRDFGFLVTESGGGYTWSDNSRENRLTPWTNDPVSDARGEALYVRDVGTGQLFSPTPLPCPAETAYEVRHEFGASTFTTEVAGLRTELTLTTSAEGKLKLWQLNVQNQSEVTKELEIVLYLELVLGITRAESYRNIITDFDATSELVTAVNRYNNEFAGNVVFVGCSKPLSGYTTDRLEFVGRHRDLSSPIAFEASAVPTAPTLESTVLTGLSTLIGKPKNTLRLSKKTGTGLDPCAALASTLVVQPGEHAEITFFLGVASSSADARAASKKMQTQQGLSKELAGARSVYGELVSAVQVSTPDRSFDLLMNGWLLYQTMSCRILGRSALYQSGGAFGFRDQLQDSLAFLLTHPQKVREQILLHASRQFVEGDVQHWWHPPTGRGVRTRISDDYLWLPYAVHGYLEATGDKQILEEEVPFIEGRLLEEHEMEAYIVPNISGRSDTLYGHAVLSLDRAFTYGPHGLPLIGGGDWNDGMNEVGRHGKGESVWLAWFIAKTALDFAPICEMRGDTARAERYRREAEHLVRAIEERAWDGEWYLRAYFDDGSPLGSHRSDECQIDSLSQSWSVITGLGDPVRREQAMNSVYSRLVRRDDRLIALLEPPFDRTTHNPGYIKGYLPGIRENGGQYTHAATWVILATALLGRGELAHELFSLINPINLTSDPAGVARYKAEPYVLCGDVYSVSPLAGHSGWSWYTGSSGWMYRVGLEGILGLRLVGGEWLEVRPCVPSTWKEFSVRFTRNGITYAVEIHNPNGVQSGVKEITVDGRPTHDGRVPLQRPDRKEPVSVKILMG